MDSSTAYMLIAAAFAVGYVLGHASPAAPLAPPVPPDAEALDAVRPILARDGKIAAIKAYRELTQTGLREAKLAVETLE
ncbi:MAG: ribosomal protein L7/L12 [bacterium]|nr:ribosomal protein L7/L12 [bacterium]